MREKMIRENIIISLFYFYAKKWRARRGREYLELAGLDTSELRDGRQSLLTVDGEAKKLKRVLELGKETKKSSAKKILLQIKMTDE